MDLTALQAFMRESRIDAWLVHDFRGSSAVLARLLPGKRWTTRRLTLHIPAVGVPTILVHAIDASQVGTPTLPGGEPVSPEVYLSWRDLHAWLARTLAGARRVAMEYAPGCTLPVVSTVDAGTVELVRAVGVEVVSSADLIQVCLAVWSPEAERSHTLASVLVTRIKDDAFDFIRDHLRAGKKVTEVDVARHMLAGFAAAGLEPQGGPVVAVNAHSGDPHYAPLDAAEAGRPPTPIRRGDWILIDLWARLPGEANIFSDITWVAFAGDPVPDEHARVFAVVKAARDAAVTRVRSAWAAGEPIQGWELDDAARDVIVAAGHERGVRHRTGHSLSAGPLVHGLGVNLDNLETHDTRAMLPGVGFTVEPGIYGDDFGVRLEINMHMHPDRGPVVTSCIQDEVVLV